MERKQQSECNDFTFTLNRKAIFCTKCKTKPSSIFKYLSPARKHIFCDVPDDSLNGSFRNERDISAPQISSYRSFSKTIQKETDQMCFGSSNIDNITQNDNHKGDEENEKKTGSLQKKETSDKKTVRWIDDQKNETKDNRYTEKKVKIVSPKAPRLLNCECIQCCVGELSAIARRAYQRNYRMEILFNKSLDVNKNFFEETGRITDKTKLLVTSQSTEIDRQCMNVLQQFLKDMNIESVKKKSLCKKLLSFFTKRKCGTGPNSKVRKTRKLTCKLEKLSTDLLKATEIVREEAKEEVDSLSQSSRSKFEDLFQRLVDSTSRIQEETSHIWEDVQRINEICSAVSEKLKKVKDIISPEMKRYLETHF